VNRRRNGERGPRKLKFVRSREKEPGCPAKKDEQEKVSRYGHRILMGLVDLGHARGVREWCPIGIYGIASSGRKCRGLSGFWAALGTVQIDGPVPRLVRCIRGVVENNGV